MADRLSSPPRSEAPQGFGAPPNVTSSGARATPAAPAATLTDMRIGKRIHLGERASLEAMADAFNLINRFNVADVNPLWDSGHKTTAAFDSRQFQFALKLVW